MMLSGRRIAILARTQALNLVLESGEFNSLTTKSVLPLPSPVAIPTLSMGPAPLMEYETLELGQEGLETVRRFGHPKTTMATFTALSDSALAFKAQRLPRQNNWKRRERHYP